jgi:hypothetical protein
VRIKKIRATVMLDRIKEQHAPDALASQDGIARRTF